MFLNTQSGDNWERPVEPICDDCGSVGGHRRRSGPPYGAVERAHSHLGGRRQSDILPERGRRPAGGQRLGAILAPPTAVSQCCKWRVTNDQLPMSQFSVLSCTV